METAGSYETSETDYQTTRSHISEPSSLHDKNRENLVPDIGYPDRGLSWFSSVCLGKHRDGTCVVETAYF
jgi:hypothetical protein